MASTYLTRTPSSTGSRRTGTWSAWIKKSDISSEQVFLSFGGSMNVGYTNGDSLRFNDGTGKAVYSSNLQRDTLGWYNFVIAIDTTQGTEANRLKMYINGVQVTSFSATVYPSLNQDLNMNQASVTNTVGSANTSAYFNGLMSHVHWIDGTAYDASAFGSTDATTGEWKINTSPSVTYGTNGFFILKDGNSVTDQSGKGNNFTVGGGTLTSTKDCPSNVFSTMNLLANFGTQWALFENGNTYVRSAGSGEAFIASTLGIPASSGKFYAEVRYTSGGSESNIGLASTSFPTSSTDYVGKALNSYSYSQNGEKRFNNNSSSYGNSYAPGDLIGIAVDATNSKLYFSKNGVWQNSGVPTSGSTGTGAIPISATPTEGFYYMACSKESGSTKNYYKWNFGNGFFGTAAVADNSTTTGSTPGTFEYDVPAGYEPLSTKGLNA